MRWEDKPTTCCQSQNSSNPAWRVDALAEAKALWEKIDIWSFLHIGDTWIQILSNSWWLLIKIRKCQRDIWAFILHHLTLSNLAHSKRYGSTKKSFPKLWQIATAHFTHLFCSTMKKQLRKRSILLKKLNSPK